MDGHRQSWRATLGLLRFGFVVGRSAVAFLSLPGIEFALGDCFLVTFPHPG